MRVERLQMRVLLLMLAWVLMPSPSMAWHRIVKSNIKSLEVVLNDDFMLQPVMELGSRDVLTVSFDELSHNYHRFTCHIEPCNPDWTPTEGLFESDWLEGFNDLPIEDYQNSLNTNQLYTHYRMQLPNDQARLKMSGNYRLHILDDSEGGDEVACVELMVVEPLMNVGLGVTTNTDVDFQLAHQQVSMTLNYNAVKVSNPDEQLQVVVRQNGREDNQRHNPRPNYITPQGLRWEHNRELIFQAGNEYHKFEVLDPNRISLGLDHVSWDEATRTYHAYPYVCTKQRSYIYERDADGAFLLRNSDDYEAATTSEYVYVHYKLAGAPHYDNARLIIDGQWTTEPRENYVMDYDEAEQAYNAVVLQKLGYYNYQLLLEDMDGTTHPVPEEGSFYQTQNRYQAYAYYRGSGERSWRLVGYQEIVFSQP